MTTHLYKNVLVTGPSGNLGSKIAEALINFGENISLLVRKESIEKESIKKLVNLGGKVIVGDLSDEQSLSEILKDVDAIVCAHQGDPSIHQTIINASKKSKNVKLIIPSIWSMFNPDFVKEGENPIADANRVTLEILRKSDVPFIAVLSNAFLEYAVLSDFLGLNLPSNQVTFYGDGNQKFYATSTFDIAKLVPYILNDESKIGKLVSIASGSITANKVIEIYENITGKKVEKKVVTEEELEAAITKSSSFFEIMALKAQRSIYFRNTVFSEPTNEVDYPNVKLQSIEDFLKNNLKK
eukprot:gene9675-1881_t